MIDELHVRNVALIESAVLEPAAGLTVITGETGSGKTALLAAFKLLCGARADASAVAQGAERLEVQARFVASGSSPDQGAAAPPHDGEPLAPDLGDEAIVARTVTSDGRSRASINGSMVTVGQLAQSLGATIDLCGQHEHQRLLKSANHRTILDSWARDALAAPLASYSRAFAQVCGIDRAIDDLKSASQVDVAQVEQARFTLRRIDELAPEPGEYEQLGASVAALENSFALKQAAYQAHEALSGDGGATELLGRAASLLEGVASYSEPLRMAASTIRESAALADDAARDVSGVVDQLDFDAARLEQMQERLGALQSLVRSYGPDMQQVYEAREAAQATIDAVEGFQERLDALEEKRAQAESALVQEARRLFAAHKQAAPELSRRLTQMLAGLNMEGARLECAVSPLDRAAWTASGPDHVELLFAPGEGLQAQPLSRIASGGELSRVMLACKVLLGADDAVDTLVFDEVDAGVGGAAARAVARCLAQLAKTHQVIVVTHLPQVAVLADAHYVVSKSSDERPVSTIEPVRGQAQVAEIARMLSGDTGSVARAHAAKMLEEASKLRLS